MDEGPRALARGKSFSPRFATSIRARSGASRGSAPKQRIPRNMLNTIGLALSLLVTPLAPPHSAGSPALRPDEALESRELAAIAEEQALLQRQLQRLRQTIEVLSLRLESEGRTRAVGLLKEGLTLLDTRASDEGRTLGESMEEAFQRIEKGQLIQSLENQTEIVNGLTQLLAVLMERDDRQGLEDRIDRVRKLQIELSKLSQAERQLQKDTQTLRENSATDASRKLAADLKRALEEQRELLRQNEASGRSSGSTEMEMLERALGALRENQRADRSVLEAWDPAEQAQLNAAGAPIEQARTAESRAARLEAAAREIQAALDANQGEGDAREALRQLSEETARAQRHARASGDSAAQRAAEALEKAEAALRAGENADASGLEAEAAELEQLAAEQRAKAAEARSEAIAKLEDLGQREGSLAGVIAKEVTESLEEADRAAQEAAGEEGTSETNARRAAQSTEDAARDFRSGQMDLERMSEALSASQADLAEEAKRLERGLSSAPSNDKAKSAAAGQELKTAAEAMERASASARSGDQAEASEAAREAEQALDAAMDALSEAREQRVAGEAERNGALAAAQEQLAQEAQQMGATASEAQLAPGAQEKVDQALEQAQEAMQEASQQLSEGRSASAASSQREALSALQEAQQSASQGARPTSPEDRARAEELAREQERIREEIMRLAQRGKESETQSGQDELQRASDEAARAAEQLKQGQLDNAEKSEQEVQRELENARKELEEEKRKYEELRQEELLFEIAEELKQALLSHRAQMQSTREIESQREAGERPSRSQRLHLRRVSREELLIAERLSELSEALLNESAVVFAELLSNAASDLNQIAEDLSEEGDYQTGERVQARQRDVEESILWLAEALHEDQKRREEEARKKEEEQQEEEQEGENRLVPDSAELKLLRRMELDVQDSVKRTLLLYPELADLDPADVDPLILEDIQRLAIRHERMSDLFSTFRRRLGLPEPGEIAGAPQGDSQAGGNDGSDGQGNSEEQK